MRRLRNREWFSVALLSIIIPVGSLTTFRLTGTLKEPPKVETITVEAITWEMIRPSRQSDIKWTASNSFSDENSSVDVEVFIVDYNEGIPGAGPPYDSDFLALRILVVANVSEGFIFSVVARFSRTDILADVVFQQTPSFMELHNLAIRKIGDLSAYNREAFFYTVATNQPKYALLSIIAYWIFFDKNSVDHRVSLSLETTYFNGGVFRKIVLPTSLAVLKQ